MVKKKKTLWFQVKSTKPDVPKMHVVNLKITIVVTYSSGFGEQGF